MGRKQLKNIKAREDNWITTLPLSVGELWGATLASALKGSGLKIAIIEAKPLEVAVARRQAYAISLLSGQLFKDIGIWDRIQPQIASYQNIRLSDADYAGVVQFQTQDLGTEFLGYVAEHCTLLTALQETTSQCPKIALAVSGGSNRSAVRRIECSD